MDAREPSGSPTGEADLLGTRSMDDLTVVYLRLCGSSMLPTLVGGDGLEADACSSPRRGDVIAYVPPGQIGHVIHRVVCERPDGLQTRGDGQRSCDDYLVQRAAVVGVVTARWRNGKRRKVARGILGVCQASLGRAVWRLIGSLCDIWDRGAAAVGRSGVPARWIGSRLRPRVVVYRVGPAHVIVGKRIIARYDVHAHCWRYSRRYRFLIDDRRLPDPRS